MTDEVVEEQAETPAETPEETPAETPEPKEGFWPDTWQDKLSHGDEKRASVASRYTSPEAVFDALVAAQNRISAGEIKATLPESPTATELKEWRKDNGIPATPKGYKWEADIPEEDKPYFDELAKTFHGKNATPEQANAVADWYYDSLEKQGEERVNLDSQQKQETLDALNVEWGNGFRQHVNLIENMLSKIPESVREDFKSARLPDGTAIFNNPDIMRSFAALALEANPAGTLTPLEGDPMQGVTGKIEELEKFMREHRTAYNKDVSKQEELRKLYGIREGLDRKAG